MSKTVCPYFFDIHRKITSDKYQFPYSMLCKFCVPRNKSYFDLSVLLLLFNTLKKERVKLKIFYRSHHEYYSVL